MAYTNKDFIMIPRLLKNDIKKCRQSKDKKINNLHNIIIHEICDQTIGKNELLWVTSYNKIAYSCFSNWGRTKNALKDLKDWGFIFLGEGSDKKIEHNISVALSKRYIISLERFVRMGYDNMSEEVSTKRQNSPYILDLLDIINKDNTNKKEKEENKINHEPKKEEPMKEEKLEDNFNPKMPEENIESLEEEIPAHFKKYHNSFGKGDMTTQMDKAKTIANSLYEFAKDFKSFPIETWDISKLINNIYKRINKEQKHGNYDDLTPYYKKTLEFCIYKSSSKIKPDKILSTLKGFLQCIHYKTVEQDHNLMDLEEERALRDLEPAPIIKKTPLESLIEKHQKGLDQLTKCVSLEPENKNFESYRAIFDEFKIQIDKGNLSKGDIDYLDSLIHKPMVDMKFWLKGRETIEHT